MHEIVQGLNFNLNWQSWLEFFGGMIIGIAVEIAANSTNTCAAGIATVISDAYSIYHYIMDYVNTQTVADIAYAVTYLVTGIEGGFTINCNNLMQKSYPLTFKDHFQTDIENKIL